VSEIDRRLADLETSVGRRCPPPPPDGPHWTAWCSPDELREVLAAGCVTATWDSDLVGPPRVLAARAIAIKATAIARMESGDPIGSRSARWGHDEQHRPEAAR